MIPVPGFEGRRVAVFGLGRSGITAARALQAGGAIPVLWDDGEAGRAVSTSPPGRADVGPRTRRGKSRRTACNR